MSFSFYYSLGPNQLLAMCAWKEARGEQEEGCLAVMHVIYNRMKSWRQTIQHVILGPNQFSSMSIPSDPQYKTGMDPHDAVYSDPLYRKLLTDGGSILNGTNDDETNGALYYANLDDIEKGGWFERCILDDPARHPLLVKIEHHSFFK